MNTVFVRLKPGEWKPPLIAAIGMGTGLHCLGALALEWIGASQMLAGGSRHLELFPDYAGRKLVLKSPLSERLEEIDRASKTERVAVLCSGDPMFFGIGTTLSDRFGRERLLAIPNITSVQALCARVCESRDEIGTVSFHGRKDGRGIGQVIDILARGGKAAVLTDPVHTPQWIAAQLIDSGYPKCVLIIGEDLGAPSERVRSFSPSDAAGEQFSPLNVVLVKPCEPGEQPLHRRGTECTEEETNKFKLKAESIVLVKPCGPAAIAGDGPGRIFGFDEEAFEREAGMITKMEVRAVALALLQLGPGQVLWDLGAATGSVSIEAARIARLDRVFAVERNESRYAGLLKNLEKFGTRGVKAVCAKASEAVGSFDDPDRVFIGGSGDDLGTILETVAHRLLPGGRVVQTAVLLQTVEKANAFWKNAGFEVSMVQLQVNRSVRTGKDVRLEALNPVFILSAWR